jgi:hypothetical protein
MKNKTQQQSIIKLRIEDVKLSSKGHFVVQLQEDWRYLFLKMEIVLRVYLNLIAF